MTLKKLENGLTDIIDVLANCRLGLASYGDLVCDSLWTEEAGLIFKKSY